MRGVPGEVDTATDNRSGALPTGLADLARLAFPPTSLPNDPIPRHARDTLWARLLPQIDQLAIAVCRRSHPSLRCDGPGQCHHLWCEAAQEYLMGELFDPQRPKSLAVRIARQPDANDSAVTGWVAGVGNNLWTETRRALLRTRNLPQRVDVWLSESPHRPCLQALLDEALGDDEAMLASVGPTTIAAWAEAFAADAVQWSSRFPDCDRILRHLSHHATTTELDQFDEHQRNAAHAAVLRVQSTFERYDEAACVWCGGQPGLTPEARVVAAQQALDNLDDADVVALVKAGNAIVDADRCAVVAGPHRAGRILLFADPPRNAVVDDTQRRPPWFTRFVLAPRRWFLEGQLAGDAIERFPDHQSGDVTGVDDDD